MAPGYSLALCRGWGIDTETAVMRPVMHTESYSKSLMMLLVSDPDGTAWLISKSLNVKSAKSYLISIPSNWENAT